MADSASPSLSGRELYLKALRHEPVPRPPVWFLRQSGRYLPEFRELRKKHKFEDLLREPELAAEATALPLRRFPLDCAILFSDITAPFLDAPLGLEFHDGVGPVFTEQSTPEELVDKISSFESPLRLAECVRAARREFPDRGFIGFAGAPYTLALYLLGSPIDEGRRRLDSLVARAPALAGELLGRLAALAGEFLAVQASAGADSLMLFDTWAGLSGADSFARIALPHAADAVSRAKRSGLPVTYYTRGTSGVWEHLPVTGADVISIDESVAIPVARARFGSGLGLQGNLDPGVFATDGVTTEKAVLELLAQSRGLPGHVFSTARGIEPSAKPELVGRAVELVTG